MNGKEPLITVPSKDFETVIDAGFKAKDLAIDVNYWKDRALKAENDLLSFKASLTQANFQLSKERENNTLYQDNITDLKKQVRRFKKPRRFGIGPFAGMAMSQGLMIHPVVGAGLSFNIFSFGRF